MERIVSENGSTNLQASPTSHAPHRPRHPVPPVRPNSPVAFRNTCSSSSPPSLSSDASGRSYPFPSPVPRPSAKRPAVAEARSGPREVRWDPASLPPPPSTARSTHLTAPLDHLRSPLPAFGTAAVLELKPPSRAFTCGSPARSGLFSVDCAGFGMIATP